MKEIKRFTTGHWFVAFRKRDEEKWQLYPDSMNRPIEWSDQEVAELACQTYRSYWPQEEWTPVFVRTTHVWQMP